MKDELLTAILAFAGTSLVLSAAQGKQLSLPSRASADDEFGAKGTTGEDANYVAGLVVGAAAMGAAWYAYSKARPQVRKALTVTPDY